MSDSPVLDYFAEQLAAKDWLGISQLYFDNSFIINVYLTRGYVAYSPGKQLFFSVSALDSTDTKIVEDTYVTMQREYIGMQQNLTVAGADHLQHIDLALYSHYNFYNDDDPKCPYPTIPSRAKIMAMTADPKTGLYSGCDEATFIDGRTESTLALYDKTSPYSGANPKTWQRFYKNQEKFKTFLKDGFGVSDAI